jgi:large subunit ribosomal protein L28
MIRAFSTSQTCHARSNESALRAQHAEIPPYPYGPAHTYKQSNFGLYSSRKIRFGNIVSEHYKTKTRRTWKPNVHHKRLWSEALGQFVRTRCVARTLRSIDKAGGFDQYLLGDKARRVKDLGMGGWRLRFLVLNTEWGKNWRRSERLRLGLPAEEVDELAAQSEVVDASVLNEVVGLDSEGRADETDWIDEDTGSGSRVADAEGEKTKPLVL